MRLTPSKVCGITAIATVISVYLTRSITNVSYGQINPFFAAIGGFAIPAYAINFLRKLRSQPQHLRRAVTIASSAITVPVLLIMWIGGQENAYKVQIAAMFIVISVCCSTMIPEVIEESSND